jgi:hypothetical protein
MLPRPYMVIDTAGAVHFDGLQAVAWKVLMKRTVSSVRITGIAPGQLYTFMFVQDTPGGHRFDWPTPQVEGGSRIDTDPNATSIQNFIGYTGGRLLAFIPGAWTIR